MYVWYECKIFFRVIKRREGDDKLRMGFMGWVYLKYIIYLYMNVFMEYYIVYNEDMLIKNIVKIKIWVYNF